MRTSPRFSSVLSDVNAQLAELDDETRLAVAAAADEADFMPDAIAAALPPKASGIGRALTAAAAGEAGLRGDDWAREHLREAVRAGLPSLTSIVDDVADKIDAATAKLERSKGGGKRKGKAAAAAEPADDDDGDDGDALKDGVRATDDAS